MWSIEREVRGEENQESRIEREGGDSRDRERERRIKERERVAGFIKK